MIRKSDRLRRDFFSQHTTVDLARALIGKKLVTSDRGARTSGMIVEVEAYLGHGDSACHAARGMTPRNRVMFTAAGHCYVYVIYGIHYCVNIVSEVEGIGSGVLLRAIEPIEGIAAMERRRASRIKRDLARGPGRLCQAMGINKSHLGQHVSDSCQIWLEPYRDVSADEIASSERIGVSSGIKLPLRFFLRGNLYVSGSSRA